MSEWTPWLPFPDPRKGGFLSAPFGPGVYELRHRYSRKLILVGRGKNCALRMTSLLPPPLGGGTRNNDAKRAYVKEHLPQIEYRTVALSAGDAVRIEGQLRSVNSYLFLT